MKPIAIMPIKFRDSARPPISPKRVKIEYICLLYMSYLLSNLKKSVTIAPLLAVTPSS